MKQEISAAAEVATEQSAMVGDSQDANLDVQIKDEDERALDSQCSIDVNIRYSDREDRGPNEENILLFIQIKECCKSR